MMQHPLNEQRHVAALALEVLAEHGFVLAGASAIREHGLIARPTQDVDLFTTEASSVTFDDALACTVQHFTAHGYTVEIARHVPLFARLVLTTTDSAATVIDMGVDWRGSPPFITNLGPILAIDDAVGNKIAALFSRGEFRDYLDADAIRQSRKFTDEELYDLAARADPGFSLHRFRQQLESFELLEGMAEPRYGISADELDEIRSRIRSWARSIQKLGQDN